MEKPKTDERRAVCLWDLSLAVVVKAPIYPDHVLLSVASWLAHEATLITESHERRVIEALAEYYRAEVESRKK